MSVIRPISEVKYGVAFDFPRFSLNAFFPEGKRF